MSKDMVKAAMKKILKVIPFLFLGACGEIPVPTPVVIQHEKLNLAPMAPVSLDAVQFKVITKENQAAVFDSLEKAGLPAVLLGITQEDYNKYETNLEKLQGKLLESRKREAEITKYYETPIELPSKKEDQ